MINTKKLIIIINRFHYLLNLLIYNPHKPSDVFPLRETENVSKTIERQTKSIVKWIFQA
jgi:DNA replication protein DnaD